MKCLKCNNELLNGICIFCKFEEAKTQADIYRYKKSFYISCSIYLLFSILNQFEYNYYIKGTIEIIRIITFFIPPYIIAKAYKKYPQNKFFKIILIIFILLPLLFVLTRIINWINI